MSAAHAVRAEVRLYDRLFTSERPGAGDTDFLHRAQPRRRSKCCATAVVEPSLAGAPPETRFQFERLGYFCRRSRLDGRPPVFNRTVTLRDQWAKINKGQK